MVLGMIIRGEKKTNQRAVEYREWNNKKPEIRQIVAL